MYVMEFLKNSQKISFKYGGVSAFERKISETVTEDGNTLTTVFDFEGGLRVTNIAKKIPQFDAYEWVNWLENVSDSDTDIISELWDADVTIPWAHEENRKRTPWRPVKSRDMMIYSTAGSSSGPNDFAEYSRFIYPGDIQKYACNGGRSSDGFAPFFNVHQKGRGIIYAIGWTGQWNARFIRGNDDLRLMSKVEDTHFVLHPNEKIRTSSVTFMHYFGSVEDSQNKWRRLIRAEYSPTATRVKNLPLCTGVWGGLESKEAISRVERVKKENINVEYIWMDAGWAGIDTKPSYDEFTGDWYEKVGDFRVSPIVHPNGLVDYADKVHSSGFKMLLWFETERARKSTYLAKEHPEMFFDNGDPNEQSLLLRLADPEAYELCRKTVFGLIEKLGIDCYRQDFNFSPLGYWRKNDTENRRGISEITHIMALYRFWDDMLNTFPNLIIDNCASGGRRLDMETTRRSFPLWRSDAQCPADPEPEVTQVNSMNFSNWLVYSGTGTGRLYDTYCARSAYSPGMTTNYAFSLSDRFGERDEDVKWLRDMVDEYRSIRDYFIGDMYKLTQASADKTAWCAVQWNIPEQNEGMIQIFKRAESSYTDAAFDLRGIDADKTYTFRDIDGGSFDIEGAKLISDGFCVHIKERRVAKIFTYKAK